MFDQAAAPIVPPSAMPTAGIGAPLPRPDGHAKVTGSARYAGEEAGPGTLHAVMVLSSIASGQVKGVFAVLTHEEPRVTPTRPGGRFWRLLECTCWLAKRGPKVSNLRSCAR